METQTGETKMQRISWKGDMSNDPCTGTVRATSKDMLHIEWDDGRKQVIPAFIVSATNGWAVCNG